MRLAAGLVRQAGLRQARASATAEAAVRDMLAGAGWRIVNVDSTINAQRPKMAPHIPRMVATIAEDLGIPPECVNVKAKTAEKLGFVGREEGISTEAIALIERKSA